MKTKLPIAVPAILALAVLSTASIASAQDGMKGMAGMGDMSSMDKKTMRMTGSGVGVIKSIDVNNGKITIAHDPIASLKWPAMTRTFNVNPVSILTGLAVGQKVAFDVTMEGTDCTITALRRQK